jgi:hypothetical protein
LQEFLSVIAPFVYFENNMLQTQPLHWPVLVLDRFAESKIIVSRTRQQAPNGIDDSQWE